MGLVFNTNKNYNSYSSGRKYISNSPCQRSISRQRQVRALTRQNIQFLKSLGLKVVPGGRSRA